MTAPKYPVRLSWPAYLNVDAQLRFGDTDWSAFKVGEA